MSFTLRNVNARWPRYMIAGLVIVLVSAGGILAQKPTDTSVQSSPLTTPPKVPAVDSSVQASPMPGPAPKSASAKLAPGTAVPVQLTESLDSGTLKNGATVHATLIAAVKLSGTAQTPGTVNVTGSLPAGSPVELSVIETVPADKIASAGEISLQLMRVGQTDVFTDTQTFNGKPGRKDLPDSSPAKGTEATLAAGTTLTFHVQPPPTAAIEPPRSDRQSPGAAAPPPH